MGDNKDEETGESVGPPTIWAKGDAGWFEILPDPSYQAIYEEIMEGIKSYFFFVDLYTEAEETRSVGRPVRIDMKVIFKKYSECVGLSRMTEDEITGQFAKHATFLISQMGRDGTFVSWKKKAIWEWLKGQFPEIYQSYKANAADLTKPTAAAPDRRAALAASSNGKEGKCASPSKQTACTRHSRAQSSTSGEDPIVEDAVPSTTDEATAAFSLALSISRSPPRHSSRSGKGAGKNAILRTPGRSTLLGKQGSPDPSESSGDEEDNMYDAVNETPNDEAPTDARPSNKRSRLSPDAESDSASDSNLDPGHVFDSNADAEIAPANANVDGSYRDADYADEIQAPQVQLEVIAEALPSSVPTGQRGTWKCNHEGCEYQVPAADKPKGRQAIRMHFLEHADEFAVREDLVIMEGKRECLPINNLLEKIRRMGEQQRQREEEEKRTIGGKVIPMPLKRKLEL